MRVKKLTALILTAAYFAVAPCRFACALAMSAATIVVEQRTDNACCHHDHSQKHGRPAPCCTASADNTAALLPTVIMVSKTQILVAMIPAVDVAVPIAQLRAFSENHDPPLTVLQIVDRSPLSPRAPPSLLAVL